MCIDGFSHSCCKRSTALQISYKQIIQVKSYIQLIVHNISKNSTNIESTSRIEKALKVQHQCQTTSIFIHTVHPCKYEPQINCVYKAEFICGSSMTKENSVNKNIWQNNITVSKARQKCVVLVARQ